MTTAVMVSRGGAGHAVRTDPARLAGHPGVVDDWTLHPLDGPPLSMVIARCGGGYALLVSHIDPEMASTVRAMGLPDEMAMEIYVLTALDVDSDVRAREVGRHLARNAVTGVLPMPPARPEDVAVWRAATVVVATIVRRTRAAAAQRGKAR